MLKRFLLITDSIIQAFDITFNNQGEPNLPVQANYNQVVDLEQPETSDNSSTKSAPTKKKTIPELFPSIAEIEKVKNLIEEMSYFKEASEYLQRESCTMLEVRTVLDILTENQPVWLRTSEKNYISAKSELIVNKSF